MKKGKDKKVVWFVYENDKLLASIVPIQGHHVYRYLLMPMDGPIHEAASVDSAIQHLKS